MHLHTHTAIAHLPVASNICLQHCLKIAFYLSTACSQHDDEDEEGVCWHPESDPACIWHSAPPWPQCWPSYSSGHTAHVRGSHWWDLWNYKWSEQNTGQLLFLRVFFFFSVPSTEPSSPCDLQVMSSCLLRSLQRKNKERRVKISSQSARNCSSTQQRNCTPKLEIKTSTLLEQR